VFSYVNGQLSLDLGVRAGVHVSSIGPPADRILSEQE
jgi:hypothetical protein